MEFATRVFNHKNFNLNVLFRKLLFVNVFLFSSLIFATGKVDLKVKLLPQLNSLRSSVELHWDQPESQIEFLLHKNLKVTFQDKYTLELVKDYGIANLYRMKFDNPIKRVLFFYQGEINEPISDGQSTGIITDKGVSLLPESYWFPRFLVNLGWTIEVELPSEEWKVKIPGHQVILDSKRIQFTPFTKTNDLVMVADRFKIFEKITELGTRIQVWLKSDDQNLADSYLNLIPGYIESYSSQIGDFPFDSYSVIENSLETGYAFPGFTLLGPSVIQLPFLLRSSLPHEILHSWWGNSVLVDYGRGNWCEGLTSYMADHHYANVDGKGVEYRRSTLQKFQDFVHQENDFPLRKFVSRNDLGTQAVGYGKSMMIFQMLENLMGHSLFYHSLSQLYLKNQSKEIAFSELQSQFENEYKNSLEDFFGPWLDQLGAPTLLIEQLELNENKISLILRQSRVSGDHPYVLPIKVKFLYPDQSIENFNLTLKDDVKVFDFLLKSRPKKLWVDPEYEVFRTLYPEEMPFAFSQILSESHSATIIVPAKEFDSFRPWSQALQSLYSKPINFISDDDPLPEKGVIWIVGHQNKQAQLLSKSLSLRSVLVSQSKIQFGNQEWNLSNGVLFVGDKVDQRPIAWVWTDKEKNAELFVQKIKHYTTFSMVGFTQQKNDFKLTWPVITSPLIVEF